MSEQVDSPTTGRLSTQVVYAERVDGDFDPACLSCRLLAAHTKHALLVTGNGVWDRDGRIAQAEWEVVEAACKRREFQRLGNQSFADARRETPQWAFAKADHALQQAVDRLLSLRQEAEKET